MFKVLKFWIYYKLCISFGYNVLFCFKVFEVSSYEVAFKLRCLSHIWDVWDVYQYHKFGADAHVNGRHWKAFNRFFPKNKPSLRPKLQLYSIKVTLTENDAEKY